MLLIRPCGKESTEVLCYAINYLVNDIEQIIGNLVKIIYL